MLTMPFVMYAQDEKGRTRFMNQAGVDLGLARVEGDAPSYLRQSASDFSTNFGTNARYHRRWGAGLGIYGITTVRLFENLGIDVGYRLNLIQTIEDFEVKYDPANFLGVTYAFNEVRNKYLNFTPSVGIRGSWKRFGLIVGAEAAFFIAGQTTVNETYNSTTGEVSNTSERTRLDTQDQPVYLDPLHFGGIADYTTSNGNRNHGASPVWFSAFVSGEYKLLANRRSPLIGFTYRMPLMEILLY